MEPTVVIVDESRETCDIVRVMLDSRGYRTLSASDGHTGLDLIRASIPQLAILNVRLPAMNGFALMMKLRRETTLASMPVILLSGLPAGAETTESEWGHSTGAQGFFNTPFEPDRFITTVRELTSRTRPAP